MKREPAENSHVSAMMHSIRATPAPLWLLQKEDTRFLYLSFLFSTIVHGILFLILVATRIFHPYAGTSTRFDLVWLSQPSLQGTKEPAMTSNPTPARHIPDKVPSTPKKPPEAEPLLSQTPAPKPAPHKDSPKTTQTPPEAPKGSAEASLAGEEMVITRYGGKVAEILEKKSDVPLFRTFSSFKVKSSVGKADVREIIEKKTPAPAQVKVAKAPEGDRPKQSPVRSEQVKPEAAPITASPASTSAGTSPATLPPRHFQLPNALNVSASLPVRGATASDRRPANEQTRMAAAGTPGAAEASKPSNTAGGKGEAAPVGNPSVAKPATPTSAQQPIVREPSVAPPKEKPQAPSTEKPKTIFHPPLAGDLKLLVTCAREIKVEAAFREFRKDRRGKALSRWEDRNRRTVAPKTVRTGENAYESVIEVAEEGIYDIQVKSADGRPIDATFVLKIRESGPGSKTKRLGRRNVPQTVTVARVLMPEGILWDEDDAFTGNMEDSGSVTKFNVETGLTWREYK